MQLPIRSGNILHLLRLPKMVLGDCWIYSVDEFIWTEVQKTSVQNVSGPWPGARHSHAMAADMKESLIYMVGGISDNDTTLCSDSFWVFDADSNKWSHIDEWDAVGRRVGHSIVKCKNSLIIVGGYGADSSYSFDFLAAILDLETNTTKVVSQVLYNINLL